MMKQRGAHTHPRIALQGSSAWSGLGKLGLADNHLQELSLRNQHMGIVVDATRPWKTAASSPP